MQIDHITQPAAENKVIAEAFLDDRKSGRALKPVIGL